MIQIDMPMPKNCANCCFATADLVNGIITLFCMTQTGKRMYTPDLISREDRPEWCPLKEQEAVEPTINEYGEAYCICGENVGIIPNSKNLPSVRSKYCSECGRRMKWNEIKSMGFNATHNPNG